MQESMPGEGRGIRVKGVRADGLCFFTLNARTPHKEGDSSSSLDPRYFTTQNLTFKTI